MKIITIQKSGLPNYIEYLYFISNLFRVLNVNILTVPNFLFDSGMNL